MATKNTDKNHYDVIIVGSGVSGLLIAQAAAQSGKKTLILESRDELGGHLKPAFTEKGSLHSSLEFVPAEGAEAFDWLEKQLGTIILGSEEEAPPVTFDSGEFKTFVGFGDQKFRSRDEANWYCAHTRRPLLSRPEDWVRELCTLENFDRMTMHEVTAYNLAEGRIQSVTVNGSKILSADDFIHAAPVSLLTHLLPENGLKSRERTALAKSEGWTSVGLHFTHSKVVTSAEVIHILKGSSTDFEPCIGRFFSPTDEGLQDSVWITLISDEHSEDMEYIGSTLRHMRKQIKRAYPESLDLISNEKIIITPQGVGYCDLKLKEPWQLTQVSNLWLASQLLSPQRGVGASVDVARQVLESWIGPIPSVKSQKTKLGACPEHSAVIPQ